LSTLRDGHSYSNTLLQEQIREVTYCDFYSLN
jgi:hypothetical protein